MLSVKLLHPVDPAQQQGALLCIQTWEMPARRAPGGVVCTTAARLLILSKN